MNRGCYAFGKSEQNYTLTIQFDEEYNNYKGLSLTLKYNGDIINQLIEDIISHQGYRSRLNIISSTREVMPIIMNAVDESEGIQYSFVLENKVLPYYILR